MHWGCCKIATFSREALQQVYDDLTPSRKERIDRLRKQADQQRSLAAEKLVYQVLQEQFGITNAKLHCRENGSPYLSGCELYVSISHSEEMVACAIGSSPVGIDIERVRPINLNICRHVCLPEEMAYLNPAPQDPAEPLCQDMQTLLRFYEIWTAKEAYYKRQGTGITDLKKVNILNLPRQGWELDGYYLQIV